MKSSSSTMTITSAALGDPMVPNHRWPARQTQAFQRNFDLPTTQESDIELLLVDLVLGAVLIIASAALFLRFRARPSIETLINAAPDAMLTVDAQGIIRAANQHVHVIFGYTPRELLGQPI